jgi:aminoglycoside phosphotransferase (APT) family kinase protein
VISALRAGEAVAELLGEALQERYGEPRRVEQLSIRSNPYRSSFAIHDVDLVLDDGTPLELLVKNVSWLGLRRRAAAGRPTFLHDPLREIETYRNVLAPHVAGPPVFFGAVADPEQDRYWVLLERVSGLQLADIGEFEVWEEAARFLARMHVQLAASLPELGAAARERLLRYDADFYAVWARRAHAFVGARPVEARLRAGLEHIASRYDAVVARLVELPATVLHGEFYSFNVLAERRGGLRICPVDWETAALGPGLVDLAGLVAGSWSAAEKRRLALAYHDAAGDPRAPDEFLAALDWCRLHVAVQWVGWSEQGMRRARWREWAAEAVDLAESLGL